MKRFLFVSILFFLGLSCSSKKEDGTSPTASELPTLEVNEKTPNLLLTWIDEKGDAHVETNPTDIPSSARSLVRIVISDKTDGTGDRFYIADLNSVAPNGSYRVKTMPRSEWEQLIESRRNAFLGKTTAPNNSAAPPNPSGSHPTSPITGVTAILYGASWCKPCHDAQAYLQSKGVNVIHKDIDENPAARKEMMEKLEKSGQRGGSIPVIDIGGQILVGYSASAMDRAIAKAVGGTAL